MEDYITREEHRTFADLMKSENEKLEQENNRQNNRLAVIEATIQQINALALSVERLAASVENMAKEQSKINKSLEKQGERIGTLENKDGEKWRTVGSYILTTVIALLIGFVASKIGLK